MEKLPIQPATKQKTRGQASSTHEPTQSASVLEIAESIHQSFKVSKKVHKTITAFFPASVQDREGRKVIGNDLVHAMCTLGFEIQKRHRSEWYFEPTWKRNAPITIHEPHPSDERRFDTIRFEANKMARKYGWSNETFVLATSA
ncbi:MAG: hypothetical protein Q9203_004191 [Teloschistes exilis]